MDYLLILGQENIYLCLTVKDKMQSVCGIDLYNLSWHRVKVSLKMRENIDTLKLGLYRCINIIELSKY